MFELWFDCDLSKPQIVHEVRGNVFSQDSQANKIGVRVKSNGANYTLSGTVKGYIILADGTLLVINGTRSGNAAYIILPADAYAVVGQIGISIQSVNGDTKTTLLACTGYVHQGG